MPTFWGLLFLLWSPIFHEVCDPWALLLHKSQLLLQICRKVGKVQKSVLILSYIYKSSLKIGTNRIDMSQENIAYCSFTIWTFNVKLHQLPLINDGYSRLFGCGVNDNFFCHKGLN